MASTAFATLGMLDKYVTKTLMTASLMNANTILLAWIFIWLVCISDLLVWDYNGGLCCFLFKHAMKSIHQTMTISLPMYVST